MQKIVPFLWFDDNCEEAVNYYIKTFNEAPNRSAESKIISLLRYEEGMQTPGIEKMVGKVLTAVFELSGQRFMALDGGPVFKFNEAVSLYVECDDQAEVDYFWSKLSASPENEQCGWCKDQFGVSWQIVPKRLDEMAMDPNRAKAHASINAMLDMKKLDLAELEKAFDNA